MCYLSGAGRLLTTKASFDSHRRESVRRSSGADEESRSTTPTRRARTRGPCERLQHELLRAREELVEARNELVNTTAKWMQCEADLRRESEISKLAQGYIPENLLDEFSMAIPCRQPVWEG